MPGLWLLRIDPIGRIGIDEARFIDASGVRRQGVFEHRAARGSGREGIGTIWYDPADPELGTAARPDALASSPPVLRPGSCHRARGG